MKLVSKERDKKGTREESRQTQLAAEGCIIMQKKKRDLLVPNDKSAHGLFSSCKAPVIPRVFSSLSRNLF